LAIDAKSPLHLTRQKWNPLNYKLSEKTERYTLSTRVIQPGDFELKGVFLIPGDSLLKLDDILDEVEKEFARFTNRKVNEAVKKRIADLNLDVATEKDELKKKIASEYPFKYRECEIEVVCESKKKLVAKRFADILADPQIDDEKPLFATVKMRNGDAELKIRVLGQFVADEIDFSISPNNTFARRAGRQIRDWAEDHRRFGWYQKLALPFGSLGFGLCVSLLLAMPAGLFRTTSDKSEVVDSARELLADGLSKSETQQAMETLLRLQVNDFKSTSHFAIQPWYLTLVIVAAGLLLFGVLCPKSTIGVGQQQKRLQRIEFYTGKMWFWIGAWVFAIFTSALGTVLLDLVRTSLQPSG